MIEPRFAFTPKAHAYHTNGIPCGCWTGQLPDKPLPEARGSYSMGRIAVCSCGAAYDGHQTIEFPIWRCYDCGGGWISKERDEYRLTAHKEEEK